VRYTPREETAEFWRFVRERLGDVLKDLGIVAQVNDRATRSVEGSLLEEERRRALLLELTAFGGRLQGLMTEIDKFCDLDGDRQVRWLSHHDPLDFSGRGGIRFASAPVVVAPDLRDSVYDPLKSVVLSSATLCVDGRIDFLGDRLGLSLLDATRFTLGNYASPFNYKKQVLTLVPDDVPTPGSPGWESRVAEAIYDLVSASGGRAFVLFTSYALLRKTHALLAPRLEADGLLPLAQGEADRSDLLERFRAGTRGVLFGTDSFWEGVDVKGRSLECVIITRLPFRVPSEPLQEARMEELESRGKHPFMSFTVPQAVLKLKQGFGRLIRSTRDRGVVAILDPRVVTKRYGKIFLRSLPETRFLQAPFQECVKEVERFFEETNGPENPCE
jgi:ATP-dependent DNA helicase DinG